MDPLPFARLADPLQMAAAQWSVATLAAQTLLARGLGAAAIAAAQRQRYDALVAHARLHSPFYRKRWRHLPAGVPALADLPVVTKQELMAAFDDWCTDRAIDARDVARFLGTRAHIGERYRGRYVVWTSSGTTGTPGVFVQDEAALAAYDALVSVQLTGSAFAACDWSAAVAQGGRAALVTADCDHFASIASWRRVAHGKPWLDMKSFAVTLPLPDIVAGLECVSPGVRRELSDGPRAARRRAGGRTPAPAPRGALGRRRGAVARGAGRDRGRVRLPAHQRVRRVRVPDDRLRLPRRAGCT